MTKIKFCGLTTQTDISFVNELKPDYIGFVFFKKSKRYITPEKAADLKKILSPNIKAVGVFVDESSDTVIELLNENVIDIAQLHGNEDNKYIDLIKDKTNKTVIKALKIHSEQDVKNAEITNADYILFDKGMGEGKSFDWKLVQHIKKPYFLAGGLDADNVAQAIRYLKPFAVDVSSGIETNGKKDKEKMQLFITAVNEGG